MFKGQIRSLLLLPILIGGVCFPVSAEDYPAYQLTHMVEGAGHASWSPDGTMIAFESMGSNHDIWVIPAKGGEPTQITTHAANDKQPDWSPDGQSLVYESERSGAQGDIWRYDFQTQTHTQLTTYSWIDWSPKWSPDGTTIAYASTRNNISLDIWTLSLIDGSYTQITTNPGTEWGPAWSPDGSHILFVGDAAGNNDLYTVPVDRSEAPFQVTAHAGWDALGSWSPDGTEIVFGSDRDGNFDIWTVPVSGGDATQIIDWPSFEGNPDWSPDGSRIAFESDRGGSVQDIWIVTVAPFTRVTEGPLVNDGGNSAGVCMIDYDGDNLLDIYVVNTSLTGTKNSLFRNIGNASFEKVTGLPIVEDIAMGYGASWADFEGDDDLDVAVANFRYQASVLYLNDGQGGFAATTNGPLSAGAAGSTSASWIDNDLDNDLDLFIANSTGPISADYPPYVNFLFRNDNGTLTRITSDVIATVSRHTYGASWSDYDNDGDPDLVNSNNVGEPSDLFLNGGDGGFALAPPTLLGPEGAGVGGCSWADYDNDGDLDLYIASSSPGPSLLYRNDGGGSLSKVSDHGLGILNGRATAGVWADYDNDGDQDIFVWFNDFQVMSNSHGYLFENLGDGTFGRLSADLFECDSCSAWSAVWGDVDRDGDLDLLVARMDPQWQGRPEYMNELLYLNNGNNN
ncbi:MAG: FG-GAP-like repeat-containing protein, partial [candidate division Zixibacteria bacterium]|nr:FG-GAP-like repeat-containing protein [candidate division Zixibacteria bacterium]